MREARIIRAILLLQMAVIGLITLGLLELAKARRTGMAGSSKSRAMTVDVPIVELAPCGYKLLAPASVEFSERFEEDYLREIEIVLQAIRKRINSNTTKDELIQYLDWVEEGFNADKLENCKQWRRIRELCGQGGRLFYYIYECTDPKPAILPTGKFEEGLLVVKDGMIVLRWPCFGSREIEEAAEQDQENDLGKRVNRVGVQRK